METAINYAMAFVSIVGGIALCAAVVLSYVLARPIIKNDALISDKAKKLGYGD